MEPVGSRALWTLFVGQTAGLQRVGHPSLYQKESEGVFEESHPFVRVSHADTQIKKSQHLSALAPAPS